LNPNTHLVAKRVSPNNNRFRPPWDGSGNPLENDRFTEHRTAQDIPYSPIRTLPHALQVKLFDSRLVRRDRRAFDPDRILEDGFRRVDGDFVVCRVSMLDSEVVVFNVEI
jgi:hypothetical protein